MELPAGNSITFPNGLKEKLIKLESTDASGSASLTGNETKYYEAYTTLISSKPAQEKYGYKGAGQGVVIIDTGIDLDHPHFGQDSDQNGVADRIIFSKDFSPEGDNTANDTDGHGTHVAGIIASSDASLQCLAPDSSIISLQVFALGMSASWKDIESALEWCVQNYQINITAVNMSLETRTSSETIGL